MCFNLSSKHWQSVSFQVVVVLFVCVCVCLFVIFHRAMKFQAFETMDYVRVVFETACDSRGLCTLSS